MEVNLNQLGKRFSFHWVFRKLDAHISSNSTFFIRGSNGSGKSTLIKIISGYLTASEGTVEYIKNGEKIKRDDIFKSLTLVAPYLDLIEEFSMEEMVQYHFRFKEFHPDLNQALLLHRINLRTRSKPVRSFSSGMKQRLKLALALGTNSNLVLLDEPTSNLDEAGVRWYQDLVEDFGKNRTVVIAGNEENDFVHCTAGINLTQKG